MSTLHVDLGLNTAIMTRRFEEPSSWIEAVRQLGYRFMSVDSDALDPFFSGEQPYLMNAAKKVKALAADAGITITDYLTGYCSYRFMGLSHRDAAQRERMKTWMRDAIDIAAAMGATSIGGRFDALSVEVLSCLGEKETRMQETEQAFREIAVYAHNAGLTNIANEIMYVPSLYPHTFAECERFFKAANVNRQDDSVPVRPIVDTGHMCGQNYGLCGDELFYERWLERWGAACEVIHIQQTRRSHSDHASFSENDGGDVRIETVNECLRRSFDNADDAPWRPYLSPAKRITLVLEALPGTSISEDMLFEEQDRCAKYLRKYIPIGGIDL